MSHSVVVSPAARARHLFASSPIPVCTNRSWSLSRRVVEAAPDLLTDEADGAADSGVEEGVQVGQVVVAAGEGGEVGGELEGGGRPGER